MIDGKSHVVAEVVSADGSPVIGMNGEPVVWHPEALTPDRGFREVEQHVAAVGHQEQADGSFAASLSHSRRTFALIVDGRAHSIIQEREHIENELHPDIVAMLVDVTGKPVEVGWVRGEDGELAAPPPHVPTREEEARAALAAGVEVRSASGVPVSGTYDAIGPRWEALREEALHAAAFGEFSGGDKSLKFTTRSGEVSFQDIAQLRAVARGVSNRAAAWRRYAAGEGDAPSGTVEVP